ncbi:MAG TPA: YdiU family protein [Verrucomicrobiales bacterium]|nr:YdiU family protein [Verrucomicrobiales bacterium]HIL69501.1 YdiU family protein [Verrucomicrobiota bacterium]
MKFKNTYDSLPARFFAEVTPEKFSNPTLLRFNENLASDLGLNPGEQSTTKLAEIFSGQRLLEGSHPIAMAYAAHQFGNFVPQLGDGRALLLGEIIDPKGKRFDIQLKGAGRTVFSRNGDGKSALGPVIREYIVSEAMHHLGVPTTRALAAVSTGDSIVREGPLPGGVFTRIAASHIRIGTFQYFAARGDIDGLKILLDYSIDRHYPEIKTEIQNSSNDSTSPILFLKKVIQNQVSLVSQWMSLGFIHGVMNTDNMSISGETIDYGPCAFMDGFNYGQVYSYIDSQGRYSYMNQRHIVQWNLTRLAECLIPLVDSDDQKARELLNHELSYISDLFTKHWVQRMAAKLGLVSDDSSIIEDEKLIKMWLDYLEKEKLDFTLSFRKLSDLLDENNGSSLFESTHPFEDFEKGWKKRLKNEVFDVETIKQNMNRVNPVYIPRNHQVERAIQGALVEDLSVFNELNKVLENPYLKQPELDSYRIAPLPEEEIAATYCGT